MDSELIYVTQEGEVVTRKEAVACPSCEKESENYCEIKYLGYKVVDCACETCLEQWGFQVYTRESYKYLSNHHC